MLAVSAKASQPFKSDVHFGALHIRNERVAAFLWPPVCVRYFITTRTLTIPKDTNDDNYVRPKASEIS